MSKVRPFIALTFLAIFAWPAAASAGDFDADGFDDLVVGVPEETVGGRRGAGAVYVIYGSPQGLLGRTAQQWSQDSPGVRSRAADDERFGEAFAVGDLNGDGFDDLIVGVPLQRVGNDGRAGAVHVLFGCDEGLSASGSQYWTQESPGVKGRSRSRGEFGGAVSAGDFNGDGIDDVAIGAAGDDPDHQFSAGSVHVLYGTPRGLTGNDDQVWSQASPGIPDDADFGERFGSSLCAADLDGDGWSDLIVGVRSEDYHDRPLAGAVHLLQGGRNGLRVAGNLFLRQGDSNGIADDRDDYDEFGASFAAADFDGDGRAELIIGVPGESIAGQTASGAFHLLHGAPEFGDVRGSEFWHQNLPRVGPGAQAAAFFARSLATGDFDGNGHDDLAVGVPGTIVNGRRLAGAIQVFWSGPRGLRESRSVRHVNPAGSEFDTFGFSLSGGDYDGDGFVDLAVAAPGASVAGVRDAGVVYVYRGSAAGFDLTPERWHVNRLHVRDRAQRDERFGVLSSCRVSDRAIERGENF